MDSVINIVDCTFTPMRNQVILSVDVIPLDKSLEGRNYLVVASPQDVATKERLQKYVEKDIASQRKPTPDWTGESWKTTQV